MSPKQYADRAKKYGWVKLHMKLTDATGSWYASVMQVHNTPEETLAYTQKRAEHAGLNVKYELATKEEYARGRKLGGA